MSDVSVLIMTIYLQGKLTSSSLNDLLEGEPYYGNFM